MQELVELLERIRSLNEVEIFLEASDDEITELIADLNRRQLLQGQDSEGRSLADVGGEYTDLTMELAAAAGRPKKGKGIVDLFSTGEFHKSITVTPVKQGYEFDSDPFKEDFTRSTNLLERYGADVEGLNDENRKILIDKLAEKYVSYLEKKIQG